MKETSHQDRTSKKITYLGWMAPCTDNHIPQMFSMSIECSTVFVPWRFVTTVFWKSRRGSEAFVRWMSQVEYAAESVLEPRVSLESDERSCPANAVVPIESSTCREHVRTCPDDELSRGVDKGSRECRTCSLNILRETCVDGESWSHGKESIEMRNIYSDINRRCTGLRRWHSRIEIRWYSSILCIVKERIECRERVTFWSNTQQRFFALSEVFFTT